MASIEEMHLRRTLDAIINVVPSRGWMGEEGLEGAL